MYFLDVPTHDYTAPVLLTPSELLATICSMDVASVYSSPDHSAGTDRIFRRDMPIRNTKDKVIIQGIAATQDRRKK